MVPLSTRAHPSWSALAQDLGRHVGEAAVSTRALDRYALAHDASHYLLVPEVVVRPTSTEQVASVLRACAAVAAPVTFRAGGTSLSGQSVSDAVLVDVRRHFEGVEVLDGGRRVRVRPGATVRAVNARLAPFGTKVGPDPASEGACTMGGVIANNSSGMQCGTERNSYATTESMVIVLPSGTAIDTGDPHASHHLRTVEPGIWHGLARLRSRVIGNPESTATIERLFSMKNTMGYGINALVDFEDPVDILAHLMIGSEGTLGFVAEAVLRTIDIPTHASTGLLVFDDLAAATAAVPQLIETGTATAELLDAASLRVSQSDPDCPRQISDLRVDRHAALLVEYHAMSAEALADRSARAGSVLASLPVSDFELTSRSSEQARLWRVRKGLYSAVASARPSGTNALLEDVSVRADLLGATCASLTDLFERHDYRDSVIFGHARDGNVHFLLHERFDDPPSLRRYEAFTHDMVDLVLGHGGSLKAEHGTGRIMAPFVRRQYGDELYDVMREIKATIDPQGLLNPGNVLSEDPSSYLLHLKPNHPVEEEVDRCVECGFCEPVCPSRDLTLTPRQRIVLRRDIVAARGRGDEALARELERDYDYEGVQTCAVDGMCVTACPVLINTGDLVRRLRRESVGRVQDSLGAVAAHSWRGVTAAGGLGLTVAAAMPSSLPRGATAVGRAVVGTDIVPLYDDRLPRGGPARPRAVDDAADAVFFSACIGTMFGPEAAAGGGAGSGGHGHDADPTSRPGAAQAFLRLCEMSGQRLRTPDALSGLCCGTPWKSKGLTKGYDVMATKVVPALREASGHGRLPIVVEASSCAEGLVEMLADRAPDLRVVDAVSFVADRVLPVVEIPEKKASLVVHPTCSGQRAGTTEALLQVARAVAVDVVVPTSWGCCAFAGDRGLLHPELTESATRREAEEVRRLDADAYVSSNRTCEIGMTRATGRSYYGVLEALLEVAQPQRA
ncbi:MAG: FAD-binding and (Fe-S)-binding domain-containing protein [Ornithinimicrobium sp.]